MVIGFFIQSNAQINIGNDTLICASSLIHLHATTVGVLGTTSYTFDTIPYNPYPYTGTIPYGSGNSGTNMPFTNCDDCVTDSAIDLGFSFCFLGQEYTQCFIGTNGWITFSPNQPTTYTSTTIPNASPDVPKNCIMGPWQDWYPGGGGNGGFVRDTTLGTAPNRVFIVSWIDCPMFSCTTTYGTFQIAIYEGSNIIENYLQDKPNCLAWANGTGTQGVHNIDGTVAFVNPGRNSTQWTASNEATAFIPSGVTWLQNGNVIGYGTDIDVTPVVTTTYVASVDLCNGNTYTDTMIVTVALGSVSYSQVNATCPQSQDGYAVFTPQDTTSWSFVWQNSSGAILGSGNTNQIPDTLNNLSTGQYTVTLINSLGCSLSHSFTISSTPFNASFSVAPAALCDNAPVNFSSTSTGSVNNYLWSFGDGNTSVTPAASHNYTPIGNYTVTLIISNSAGCIDTATQNISILPNIIANFSFSPLEGCVGSPIDFTDESTNNPIAWDWNFGDQQTSISNDPSNVFNADGQYIVSLTVTDSLCGSDTKTLPIIIHFVPDVNLGNDTDVCKNEKIILDAGYPGTTYQWSTGETTQVINPPIPDHDTYYSVIVNNFGCLGYDTMLAAINCDVIMPSAFSPNGDNINDIFRPLGYRITQYDMTIFNRWGEIVYQINSPTISIGWNGTFNGEDQEVGVYIYYMNATFINGEKKSITGNVTLLR